MFSKILLLLCLFILTHDLKIARADEEGWAVESQAPVGENFGLDANPREQKNHRPVIFVPGLGGSQLWAKLTGKKTVPHFLCDRNTDDYYAIWLNLLELLPVVRACTMDNLRLHYNALNHTTSNTQGVDIEALNFGHPKSVEWLAPYFDRTNFKAADSERRRRSSRASGSVGWRLEGRYEEDLFRSVENASISRLFGDSSQRDRWLKKGGGLKGIRLVESKLLLGIFSDLAYFSDMAKALVSKGYTRGKDLMAAPYDFRKAPNEMSEFFNKTKRLIEDTFAKNGNSRVVMVAHSMGNPVMLYFYNHVVSQQWKDRHIQSHVALSAPWGGAVKSLKLMVSGDSLGLKLVKATTIRQVERSMSSVAWLLPSPALWKEDEVLVSTPARDYTVSQYGQLFRDLGHDDGYRMWLDTHKLTADMKFPGLEMHILYGKSVKTPGKLTYTRNEFPDHAPQMVPDDGDGTVNLRSLEAFRPWMNQQRGSSRPVRSLVLEKVNHRGILKDPRAIRYVIDVASK
ncbi:hypothetical protein ACOMHN_033582 [Nucella lapillus]